MTVRRSRWLRVPRQERAEAAVLGRASEQNGSAYNGDGSKGQSREQQPYRGSRHCKGVQGSKCKHAGTLTHLSESKGLRQGAR